MQFRDPRLSKCVAAAVFMTAAVLVAPLQAQERLSLSERVERLEQQASGGGTSGSVDLVNQIQALQSQVQALQGQVEELSHELGKAQQRSKDQYIDLDSRIGRIEGGAAAVAAPADPGSTNQELQDIELGATPQAAAGNLTPGDTQLTPPDDTGAGAPLALGEPATQELPALADPEAEKSSYDEAFSALKDGRYAESARRFQSFIDQYPNSDLTGNAYYWLGESYYVTQNYQVALDTFGILLARFPQNQKAPDALLKTGYCQYELKQWDAAEATLNQVLATYPDTTVSRLAQGRMRALQLENRR